MTFQSDYNPFAATDFVASKGLHDFISKFSKAQGGDASGKGAIGIAPFNRMIDGWLLSAAIAVAKEAPIISVDGLPSQKFITGAVLQKDIDTIEWIMLLAIARSGNPYIVDDPKSMVKEVRQCAEAGYPFLEEMMKDGNQPDLQTLMKSLIGIVSEAAD